MVDESLITLDEVAERLGISRVTLWRWVKDGKVPVVKLSQRKIYVRKVELEKLMTEGTK
ncbi:MAG: transcriptional regulator [Syntrophus sp. (in: bacteria)]|nr:transcriptional regulator [Syntrophus sp. (in: bacteria)]